jgi:Protein of unknown function (Hypoth_ymh)
MNILLNERSMRTYTDRYIDFLVDDVVRFHTYCGAALGKSAEDYISRMERFEEACKDLMREVPLADQTALRRLQRALKDAVATSNSVADLASHFEAALRTFLFVDETLFRRDYFDKCAFRAARDQYSDHLMFAISRALEDSDYDAAIQAAFKCLDQYLASLLKKEGAEGSFGEQLINAAFSEDGPLKLGRHPNEQRGLRNLAAGANAFFRNPVAHKNTFTPDLATLAKSVLEGTQPRNIYDSLTAQTCLAIVALLLKFSTMLAIQNKLVAEADATSLPFGTRTRLP